MMFLEWFWLGADLVVEVLLATLLAKFEFSCTKDEVVWNLSQIIGPSVKIGEEEKKGLPLKVVAIDEMPV